MQHPSAFNGGLRNADASTKKGGKGCDDVLDTETGKTRASVASRRLFRERLDSGDLGKKYARPHGNQTRHLVVACVGGSHRATAAITA